MRQTLVKEGFVKGLYAGTVPAIVANVAENSVLFAGYGVCQKVVANFTGVKVWFLCWLFDMTVYDFSKFSWLNALLISQKVDDLSATSNATAGCMAAFFSSFTLCPTELIKCKLQAAREMSISSGSNLVIFSIMLVLCLWYFIQVQFIKYNFLQANVEKIGPFRLTQQVLAESGVRGLFNGLGSTIAREMPGYFVFFGGYEWAREMFTKPGGSKDTIGRVFTAL